MTTFEYEGVTITLKRPTMKARLRLTDLRQMIGYWDMPEGEQKQYVDMALNLLYLVDSVDGDLGFPVPCNGNATPETVHGFIDNILDAHENLYLRWANALYSARQGTQQDADLLPGHELTDDQKKASKSEKSDSNKK